MKVLVAEDDQFTRNGLVEVLESEGYQVIAAADGTEAIRRFQDQRPDFVCLDIMMPGRSGYEACSAIRADCPDVPIIFISAKSEEVDRLVGFEVGADDFITKPFSVREVVARVRAVARRCCAAKPEVSAEFTMGDLTYYQANCAQNGVTMSSISARVTQRSCNYFMTTRAKPWTVMSSSITRGAKIISQTAELWINMFRNFENALKSIRRSPV